MKSTVPIIVVSTIFLVWITGCTKRPDEELMQAKKALEAAVATDADRYAPYEYDLAQNAFNAGVKETQRQDSAFVLSREYTNAKKMLLMARDQALAAKNSSESRQHAVTKDSQDTR